jgi:hypothetical protein
MQETKVLTRLPELQSRLSEDYQPESVLSPKDPHETYKFKVLVSNDAASFWSVAMTVTRVLRQSPRKK